MSICSLFFTGHISLWCNIQLSTQPVYNFALIRSETSLLVSTGTSCQNSFHPLHTLASTAASASPSTCHQVTEHIHWLQTSTITNIHTGRIHTSSLICAASTYKSLSHFNHATLYTTTLPLNPFLTLSTLYWVFTNTSTTNATLPSSSIEHSLVAFSTNHNFSFVHIQKFTAEFLRSVGIWQSFWQEHSSTFYAPRAIFCSTLRMLQTRKSNGHFLVATSYTINRTLPTWTFSEMRWSSHAVSQQLCWKLSVSSSFVRNSTVVRKSPRIDSSFSATTMFLHIQPTFLTTLVVCVCVSGQN